MSGFVTGHFNESLNPEVKEALCRSGCGEKAKLSGDEKIPFSAVNRFNTVSKQTINTEYNFTALQFGCLVFIQSI